MAVIDFIPLAGQLSLDHSQPLPIDVIETLVIEHLPTNTKSGKLFRACIAPLFNGLRWLGDERSLVEALHYHSLETPSEINPMAIRGIAANLGYNSHTETIALSVLDRRLLPCLFMMQGRPPLVILDKSDHDMLCFDSDSGSTTHIGYGEEDAGNAVFFTREALNTKTFMQDPRWFKSVVQRFEKYALQILILSFFITLLALASPLMVMAVYDTAIASSSRITLAWLAVGMCLLTGAEAWLRIIRTKSINFAGARIDNITSRSTFERLLFLAPAYTERATVAAQVARIKDFESVREFITGNLALIFLELPFTLMFIIAIGFISGMLCLVPLSILVVYSLMILVLHPRMKRAMFEASRSGSLRHEFLIEHLSKLRAIRNNGNVNEFLGRYRAISGMASLAQFRASMLSQFIEIISYVCMIMAGVATLSFGVFYAANGVITTGALIATMILSWRVLAPLQYIFASISRVEQLKASIAQMQRLMQMAPETDMQMVRNPLDNIKGKISFQRVGLRYAAEADPALLGVTFTINPGEVVAIRGANGSGKSTLSRLLVKLYQPQAGTIRIDDVDLRQLDPLQVRQAIAYVPQQVHLFGGTIYENILLAQPTANPKQVLDAAEKSGLIDDLKAFPRKLETKVGNNMVQLPYAILQGISLARALLKDSPIMVFDEVGFIESPAQSPRLTNLLHEMRGKKTILFITHREDIIRVADKLLVMHQGELVLQGPTQEVLGRLQQLQVG